MRLQRKFTGIMPSSASMKSTNGFFNNKVRMAMGVQTMDSNGIKLPPVKEDEDKSTIEISIPDFKASDFGIYVYNGELRVAVRDLDEVVNHQQSFEATEFSYKAFDFKYSISEKADIENIAAFYDEGSGLLRIEIPTITTIAKETLRRIPVHNE